MASPAAILSILVEANTSSAAMKLRAMQSQLEATGATISTIEEKGRRASRSIDEFGNTAKKHTPSFAGMAKSLLAVGAGFEAFHLAKEAVTDTAELGHSVERLTAITGLDTKTASTWIEAMKVRGVQAKAVNMGFITLSRNMRNAEDGSKTAKKAFDQLGISQASLKNDTTQQAILQVADGLEKVESPAQRAAIAQQLFGRGAQALIPVLAEGQKGVKDMLEQTQRYGAFLPNHTNAIRKAVDAQHAMSLAMDGIRLTIGTKLIPLLLPLVNAFLRFIAQMRSGTGIGGQFGRVITAIFNTVRTGLQWLVRFAGGMKNLVTAIGLVVGAFLAFKAATAVIELATNPTLLLFVALAAAAILIIKNWGPIKAFFIDLFQSIRAAAEPVLQWLENAWTNTAHAVITAWRSVSDAVGTVFDALKGTFGPVIDAFITGVQSIVPAVGPAFDTLIGIFSTLRQVMQPVLDVIGSELPAAFRAAQTVIGGVMTEIGNIISAGWVIAKNAFNTALSTIQTVMNTIAGVVRGAFQIIRGLLEVFAGLFTLDFTKMWNGIKDIFSGAVKAVVAIVTGEWGALKAAGQFVMEGLGEGFKLAWQTLKTLISTIVQSFLTIINGVWNGMFNAGKYILGGVESGFRAAVNGVLGVITGFLNDIIDVINHIPGVHVGHVTAPHFADGGVFATGGKVMAPGYFAGEEAPQHPEFILATNPRYRQRNLQLFQQAGKALNAPGFAQGGVFGYLENLWTSVGGPQGAAATMAAIAMAESGGHNVVQQGQPYATTGWGLWQITPGNSEPQFGVDNALLDPTANARAALAKYTAAGGFSPWTTFTSGAYKKFLGGAGGGGILDSILGAVGGIASKIVDAAAGGLSSILGVLPKPPKLPDWISGLPGWILDKVGGWIKDKVTGLGGLLGGGGPGGVGNLDGKPVADWIIPILTWARSHGWTGSVTSGYRNAAQQMAAAKGYGLEHYGPAGPLGSEHLKTLYPGGAVDVTQAAQLASVLQAYPMHPTLIWGGPVMGDMVHFSATGHKIGGIHGRYAGAFAKGGAVAAHGPTMAVFGENGPETALFIPGFATGGSFSGLTPTVGATVAGFSGLTGVTGPAKKVAPAVNLIQQATGEPSVQGVPAVAGNVGAAAAAAGTISSLRTQIGGLEHTYSILSQYFSQNPENLVDPNTGEINQPALNRRLGQLDQLIALRQQIFNTWGRVVALTQQLVKSYREIIRRFRQVLAGIQTKGLKGNALTQAQAKQTSARNSISKYSGLLASALGDVTSAGNDRDNAWLSLLADQGTRASVAGTTAQPIVAAGTTTGTGTGITATAGPDPLTALYQQIAQTATAAYNVSQAQYKVVQTMPPFGGSYQSGGVVPGPIGAARTIIAHGGETISNGAPEVHLHFAPGTDWLKDFVQVEIRQSGRSDSRYAQRMLPGAR